MSHWSEWLLSKCLETINAGEGAEKKEPSYTVGGNATSTATMENSVETLKKLEIELPCNPAIPVQGIHTEETRSERDTCPVIHSGSKLGSWSCLQCLTSVTPSQGQGCVFTSESLASSSLLSNSRF